MFARTFRWVIVTPFGSAVAPDVKMISASVAGVTVGSGAPRGRRSASLEGRRSADRADLARHAPTAAPTSSPTSTIFALTMARCAGRARPTRDSPPARPPRRREDSPTAPRSIRLRFSDQMTTCRPPRMPAAVSVRGKRSRRLADVPVGRLPRSVPVVMDDETSSCRARSPRRNRGACRGHVGLIIQVDDFPEDLMRRPVTVSGGGRSRRCPALAGRASSRRRRAWPAAAGRRQPPIDVPWNDAIPAGHRRSRRARAEGVAAPRRVGGHQDGRRHAR